MLPPETKRLLKALGIAIRETRLALGLSQQALAELASLHPTYISRIESGRYNIAFHNLHAVCSSLKMKVHEMTKRADV